MALHKPHAVRCPEERHERKDNPADSGHPRIALPTKDLVLADCAKQGVKFLPFETVFPLPQRHRQLKVFNLKHPAAHAATTCEHLRYHRAISNLNTHLAVLIKSTVKATEPVTRRTTVSDPDPYDRIHLVASTLASVAQQHDCRNSFGRTRCNTRQVR